MLINENIASNFVFIQHTDNMTGRDVEFLKALENVNDVITDGIFQDNGLEYELIFDGNGYIIENELFIISRKEGELISKNEYLEFNNRFKDKQILYGRAAQNEYELVVTFNLLEILELSIDDVLGKTINLPIYQRDFLVVGVFCKEYEYISNMLNYTVNYYVNMDLSNFNMQRTRIFLSDYNSAYETINKINDNFDGQYTVFYWGDYINEYYSVFEKQKTLCNEIMLVIGSLLLIVSLINLLTIVLYDIKRKGIYFGVFKAQGGINGSIYLIIFVELAILFTLALVSGIFVSSIIVNLLGKIITSGLYVELTASLIDYFLIGVIVLCSGFILLALLSFILLRIHIKRDVVKLL
ncbi:MAG: hypothetical protein LBQ40_05035 [Clostridiales bacterium]|jgi:ABC-type antimicrobial peptide transport system permease subunit|nr:hypothetical protein [Clostridiales bacterium]